MASCGNLKQRGVRLCLGARAVNLVFRDGTGPQIARASARCCTDLRCVATVNRAHLLGMFSARSPPHHRPAAHGQAPATALRRDDIGAARHGAGARLHCRAPEHVACAGLRPDEWTGALRRILREDGLPAVRRVGLVHARPRVDWRYRNRAAAIAGCQPCPASRRGSADALVAVLPRGRRPARRSSAAVGPCRDDQAHRRAGERTGLSGTANASGRRRQHGRGAAGAVGRRAGATRRGGRSARLGPD